MRRFIPLLFIPLAFSSVACPPPPKVDPAKDKGASKDAAKKPIDVPNDLRPRIDLAIKQVKSRDLMTTNNFWTVFHGILGSGLEDTKLTDPVTREQTNAIKYICSGGEIKGMNFINKGVHGLDVETAQGFHLQGVAQGHQDQFIAEMAQWGMPHKQKFKVGGEEFTFEAFTRFSKMRASVQQKPKQELSWAILVIAHYYGTGKEPWTNMFGEKITYEDIVKFEVNEPIDQAACGGTHRLFGVTWAYYKHLNDGGQTTGPWIEVEAKIADYKTRAKDLQNKDGSFSTDYFKSKAHVDDPHVRIGTTGHIVEWLALAMTDEELKSDWMQGAVSRLSLMILDMAHDEIDGGALYHAAHGLHLYQTRVYGTPPSYLPLPTRKK